MTCGLLASIEEKEKDDDEIEDLWRCLVWTGAVSAVEAARELDPLVDEKALVDVSDEKAEREEQEPLSG